MHCFGILLASTSIVIFCTQDEDSEKYQFIFVELVGKKKGVSFSLDQPMKGMRGDANIGEE